VKYEHQGSRSDTRLLRCCNHPVGGITPAGKSLDQRPNRNRPPGNNHLLKSAATYPKSKVSLKCAVKLHATVRDHLVPEQTNPNRDAAFHCEVVLMEHGRSHITKKQGFLMPNSPQNEDSNLGLISPYSTSKSRGFPATISSGHIAVNPHLRLSRIC
jgi:hypothetical protein